MSHFMSCVELRVELRVELCVELRVELRVEYCCVCLTSAVNRLRVKV